MHINNLYLLLLFLLRPKLFLAKVFSSKYPTTMIHSCLNDANVALIFAKSSQMITVEDQSFENLNTQMKNLHHFMHASHLEHYFFGNHEIPGFKAQHQFLKDHGCCPKTFVGINELIFRKIYFDKKIRPPIFELTYLSIEFMLKNLSNIQVFDMTDVKKENIVFRQGYSYETISHKKMKTSLQNVPLFFSDNQLLGSPFLTKNLSPISQASQEILIVISKFGSEYDKKAWLIIQHADDDPFFQAGVLFLLERLANKGETDPKNYAYLYDRVAAKFHQIGLLQKYGTQVDLKKIALNCSLTKVI
ncbi:MAG: hypothetical protein EBZ47_08075 [Chlamydiae bacterium]|nr:hypothetical protein [Chlamydiota bacterium]